MRRLARSTAIIAVSLLLPAGLASSPAMAGNTISKVPKSNPANWTPRVMDDESYPEAGVLEYRQIGKWMYAGGEFRRVESADRKTTYTKYGIFGFNASTGAVTSWAPVTNGSVWALERSADGKFLYFGGTFTKVDGTTANRLVRYDLASHQVDPGFVAPDTIDDRVTDLALVGDRLFVSGRFTGGLVALDAVTGARTSYFDKVQAKGGQTGFATQVYRFAVNPKKNRLVAIGSFTSIGGKTRRQAAMVTLGAKSASLNAWYSTRWDETCTKKLKWYTRAVDFAPDGSYFAIGTTGGGYPGTTKLCDTVTRWPVRSAAKQKPAWVAYSGGDTFHSLVVTNRGIFLSGHFRWLNNPKGKDSKGKGAVSRPGLGALNSKTGKALSWNPTKSLEGGKGGYTLYYTKQGLWVGHYEKKIHNEVHEGIGFLPF